jgi:hypothetical protein
VRGLFELGHQHLQNTLEVFEHLVVPDPDNAIAKRVQFGIAHSVGWTVGMLTASNLDDEPALAAKKIRIEMTDRFLADEFEPA